MNFPFVIGDYKYEISFDNTKANFISEVNLEYGLSIIQIRRKIWQNKIEYKNKLDFFKKAIQEKIEKEKTNETPKNEKEQKKELNNMDRKANLKDYTSLFHNNLEKAKVKENVTEINNMQYNTVDFYGIILCYLNYYDKQKFSEVIDELSRKDLENLYRNIKLKCTEKKDKNKNENEEKTISESNNISNESKEITSSISNEKKRANYIENIDSILNFSINKEKVFINFTNDFWKFIINCYKKPTMENISICYDIFWIPKSNSSVIN